MAFPRARPISEKLWKTQLCTTFFEKLWKPISLSVICFSPNSVSTLRGSYGRCKGWCLIRVLTLGRSILLVNFRVKRPLWNFDMRFDCAGSHKVYAVVFGRGIFPVNFHIKWLLWTDALHFDCAGSHKVCACVLGSIWAAAFFLKIFV